MKRATLLAGVAMVIGVVACDRSVPVEPQACIDDGVQLTEADLVARATQVARSFDWNAIEQDCCDLEWIETTLDESRGEWPSEHASAHQAAQNAGLTRYAAVLVRIQSTAGTSQPRWVFLDQCGTPL